MGIKATLKVDEIMEAVTMPSLQTFWYWRIGSSESHERSRMANLQVVNELNTLPLVNFQNSLCFMTKWQAK